MLFRSFYYKAFYKPKGAWKFWEPVIRARAGLGAVNPESPHRYYDKAYLFCDVIVVGGGPAGLAAATEAARHGAEVILVEENPVLGGSLTYARFDVEGFAGRAQAAQHVVVITWPKGGQGEKRSFQREYHGGVEPKDAAGGTLCSGLTGCVRPRQE